MKRLASTFALSLVFAPLTASAYEPPCARGDLLVSNDCVSRRHMPAREGQTVLRRAERARSQFKTRRSRTKHIRKLSAHPTGVRAHRRGDFSKIAKDRRFIPEITTVERNLRSIRRGALGTKTIPATTRQDRSFRARQTTRSKRANSRKTYENRIKVKRGSDRRN